MSSNSNVAINIAAEFTGKPAFKQAENAVGNLNKNVKTLAYSLGLAYGTRALVNFSKTAVREFADAEHEALVLSNTVKNLGLAFALPELTNYVDSISRLYGVTGGQAVPAMQSLLSATGSVSKSIEIMNVALDVAANKNIDVTGVAQGLAQAFIGNTKALKKYDTGLTAAELKTKSFNDILTILATRTAGSAAASAETISGKIAILSEASNQAKESIGENLIAALARISGGSETKDAIKTINSLASAFNGVVTAVSFMVDVLASSYRILDKIASFGGLTGANGRLGAEAPMAKVARSASPAGTWKRLQLEKKAEKEALDRAKQLEKLLRDQAKAREKALKLQRDQAALDKAALALAKGEDIFNKDAIELQAALVNQSKQLASSTTQAQLLSVTTDIQRVKLKQDILDLEKAIQQGNAEAATEAATRLNKDLAIYGTLTSQEIKLRDIKEILKGFVAAKLIDQDNLDQAIAKLKAISLSPIYSQTFPTTTSTNPDVVAAKVDEQVAFINQMVAANEQLIKDITSSSAYQAAQKVEVALTLTGTDDFTNALANSLQNKSLTVQGGKIAQLERNVGFFL